MTTFHVFLCDRAFEAIVFGSENYKIDASLNSIKLVFQLIATRTVTSVAKSVRVPDLFDNSVRDMGGLHRRRIVWVGQLDFG